MCKKMDIVKKYPDGGGVRIVPRHSQDIDTDFSNFFKFCDELKADKHKGWTNNSSVCNSMIELG